MPNSHGRFLINSSQQISLSLSLCAVGVGGIKLRPVPLFVIINA